MTTEILQPMVAMFGLCFVVWCTMFVVRLGYMSANDIAPDDISTPEQVNALIPEHVSRASNNLKNLFELPVLFYALCIILYLNQSADNLTLCLAWGFVGLRALHSLVQCTFNKVMLRFAAYIGSSILLWAMMFVVAVDIF